MRNVIVSVTAREELRLITSYLAAFGSGTARSLAREFERVVDNLRDGVVEYPIARNAKLAETGHHVALFKNYLMLYRILGDGSVYIAHVFHQSQDYAAIVAELG